MLKKQSWHFLLRPIQGKNGRLQMEPGPIVSIRMGKVHFVFELDSVPYCINPDREAAVFHSGA
jgi:hypothetical protein